MVTAVPVTRRLVQRFVSGDSLEDALDAVARLNAVGCRATVDVLGEETQSPAGAASAAASYVAALQDLAAKGFEANVSVKLSQLGATFDPQLCRALLGDVALEAQRLGGFLRVDMEGASMVDFTIETSRLLRRDGLPIGTATQAYLRRTPRDIETLLHEGTSIRLCKGAYAESEDIAHKQKKEVDAAYVRLMKVLLVSGTTPAIATHDEEMIERTVEFAAVNGIAAAEFDFEMLFGVRRDLQTALVDRGFRVRTYVPYGPEWYPYFVRRLAERPANIAFVLSSLVKERRANRPH